MSEENNNVSRDIHSLHERVTTTETEISSIKNQLSRMESTLGNISHSLQEKNKTAWGVLAAWAAVILSIVALGVSGFVGDVERLDSNQTKTVDSFIEHVRDGHPDIVKVAVDANRHKIEQLDETLQREMRLLDATGNTKLESLDHRLQREMILMDNNIQTSVKHYWEHVKKLDSWQQKHNETDATRNAAQDERIKALEREIFKE